MAERGGGVEFEFLEDGSDGGTFVAAGRAVGMIRDSLVAGQVAQAAQFYEQAGRGLAKTLLAGGGAFLPETHRRLLADMFVAARDFGSAAVLHEAVGAWADAGRLHEQAGDLMSAARCLHAAGDVHGSAVLVERSGQVAAALDLHRQAGPHPTWAECLARQKRFVEAAAVYQQLGNVRAEAEMLGAVPAEDPDRLPSVKRLSAILEHFGHPQDAVQVLVDACRQVPGAQGDGELLAHVVRLMEGLGRTAEAAQIRAWLGGVGQPGGQAQVSPGVPGVIPPMGFPGRTTSGVMASVASLGPVGWPAPAAARGVSPGPVVALAAGGPPGGGAAPLVGGLVPAAGVADPYPLGVGTEGGRDPFGAPSPPRGGVVSGALLAGPAPGGDEPRRVAPARPPNGSGSHPVLRGPVLAVDPFVMPPGAAVEADPLGTPAPVPATDPFAETQTGLAPRGTGTTSSRMLSVPRPGGLLGPADPSGRTGGTSGRLAAVPDPFAAAPLARPAVHLQAGSTSGRMRAIPAGVFPPTPEAPGDAPPGDPRSTGTTSARMRAVPQADPFAVTEPPPPVEFSLTGVVPEPPLPPPPLVAPEGDPVVAGPPDPLDLAQEQFVAPELPEPPLPPAMLVLQGVPALGSLPPGDLRDLFQACTEVSFGARTVVIEQGARESGLYVVMEGSAEVQRVRPGSDPVRVSTVGPGKYVGEASLVDDARSPVRVVAATEVRALHLPLEAFSRYVETHTLAGMEIYRGLARRLSEQLRLALQQK